MDQVYQKLNLKCIIIFTVFKPFNKAVLILKFFKSQYFFSTLQLQLRDSVSLNTRSATLQGYIFPGYISTNCPNKERNWIK